MTFLGWLSDPFKGLSDLQLGDEKVILNHLVNIIIPPCNKKWLDGMGFCWCFLFDLSMPILPIHA